MSAEPETTPYLVGLGVARLEACRGHALETALPLAERSARRSRAAREESENLAQRMADQARDEELMREALHLAKEGLDAGEPPIGALLSLDGEVIASAWRRVGGETVLDHAEVVVLRDAVGDPRLRGRRRDAVLYTTLEPCLMCMGTAMFFRVRRIVYALEAVADGASEVAQVWQPDVGHPPPGSYLYDVPDVTGGVYRDEALTLFRLFAEQNRHLLWAQALLPDFARGEGQAEILS